MPDRETWFLHASMNPYFEYTTDKILSNGLNQRAIEAKLKYRYVILLPDVLLKERWKENSVGSLKVPPVVTKVRPYGGQRNFSGHILIDARNLLLVQLTELTKFEEDDYQTVVFQAMEVPTAIGEPKVVGS